MSKLKRFLQFFLFVSFCNINFCNSFNDISPDDPYFFMISHLKDVKIMNSDLNGNFNPDALITRAEALTVALRTGHISIPAEISKVLPFTDIDINSWYAPVLQKAIDTKIVSTKSNFFRPNDYITKAEFLAFLFRATKVNFSPYFAKTNNISLDISEEAWYAPHFAYAKKYQIAYLPEDELYRPKKLLNRKEVAIMTYRQSKIFNGSQVTKNLVELQAEISQFITFLRSNKINKAELHLPRILYLTDILSMTKNDNNAVAAQAISRAMTYFSEGIRAFKFGKNLNGIEFLYLSLQHVERAAIKSESLSSFAQELSSLINQTLISFTSPDYLQISQN